MPQVRTFHFLSWNFLVVVALLFYLANKIYSFVWDCSSWISKANLPIFKIKDGLGQAWSRSEEGGLHITFSINIDPRIISYFGVFFISYSVFWFQEKDEKLDGDAALNKFFRDIYQDADDDTRRAMSKSFVRFICLGLQSSKHMMSNLISIYVLTIIV